MFALEKSAQLWIKSLLLSIWSAPSVSLVGRHAGFSRLDRQWVWWLLCPGRRSSRNLEKWVMVTPSSLDKVTLEELIKWGGPMDTHLF